MTKEKQIEWLEMLAEDILHLEQYRDGYLKTDIKEIAQAMYNAGFRKQSEWISVEEIDEIVDKFLIAHDYDAYVDKWEIFNEDYMAFIEKYTKVIAKMKGGE